jgi:hypothetical protein
MHYEVAQGVVSMRHTQRGVTFVGWLFLLVSVAIVVYEGIRLTPMYLNYMRVVKALERLADPSAAQGSNTSAQSLRQQLERSYDIDSIDHPATKDVDIHREEDHWVAIADYEDVAPLFGNLSLMVHFHKEVDLP